MAKQTQADNKVVVAIGVAGVLALAGLGYAYFQAEAERHALADRVAALGQELEHLEAEKQALRRARDQALDAAQALSSDLAAAREASAGDQAALRQELEAAHAEQQRLIEAAASRESDWLAEADALQSELASARERSAALQQQLDEAQQAVVAAGEREAALEAQLDATRSDLARLQAGLAESRDAGESLRAEVMQAQQERQTLQEQLQTTLEQREQLLAQLEAVDAAMQREQQIASASLEEKQQLQKRVEAANAAIVAKEAAIAQSSSALDQLQDRLQDASSEARELAERLEALERERQAEAERVQRLREDLQQTAQSHEVQIERLRNEFTLIKLGNEILFPSGSAELKASGRRALDLIAGLLNAYPERRISVEGHTDAVPVGDNLPFRSNWELSVARSAAAVHYLQHAAGVDPARMTVVGYGEHRPLAGNDTPQGRAANRRIEILLSPPRESYDLREAAAGQPR